MELTRKAYAKINLTLDVLNKRDDGYHNIVSIMQTLSLCDTVRLKRTASGVRAYWNLREEINDGNTAIRAARLMLDKYGLSAGVDIEIEKNIPVSAGLGGGSADAAAVIEGINELFGLKLGTEAMTAAGAQIGADVPFCILKGAAVAEGIGDRLLALEARTACDVVLVKPGVGVSTKDIYLKMDGLQLPRRPDARLAADALKAGDLKSLGQKLFNVMELVTAKEYPVIKELKLKLLERGAKGALMSGSGPTVFGLFENSAQAENAYGFFRDKYQEYEAFSCKFYYE